VFVKVVSVCETSYCYEALMDCCYCMHVPTVITLILRFKMWVDGEI